MSAENALQQEPTDRERVFFDNLLVPVNPEYDFDQDPGQQYEYANPVTLNNKMILFTNAAIQLTQRTVVLARRREKKRLEKKEIDRKIKSLRSDILSKHPAPPSAAKNLALTEAYLVRCLEADGFLDGMRAMEAQSAKLEDEIELMKEEGENLRFTMGTIQTAAQNIQTHLSYVKTEAKLGFRTPGA